MSREEKGYKRFFSSGHTVESLLAGCTDTLRAVPMSLLRRLYTLPLSRPACVCTVVEIHIHIRVPEKRQRSTGRPFLLPGDGGGTEEESPIPLPVRKRVREERSKYIQPEPWAKLVCVPRASLLSGTTTWNISPGYSLPPSFLSPLFFLLNLFFLSFPQRNVCSTSTTIERSINGAMTKEPADKTLIGLNFKTLV